MKRPISLSFLGLSSLLVVLGRFSWLSQPGMLVANAESLDELRERRRQRRRINRRQRRQESSSGNQGNRPPPQDSDDKVTIDVGSYVSKLVQHRHKPRDLLEGTLMALQTTIVAELTTLVAVLGTPVVSVWAILASTGSALGAIWGGIGGLCVGTFAAVVVNIYALVRSGTALWDGALATPQTLRNTLLEGKPWNPYERQWKDRGVSLAEEHRRLLAWMEEQDQARKGNRNVADTAFYDLLQVPTDATKAAIKKAYFVRARETHPDKNRDDPKAHERFVELHAAYTVLSDDTKRADYDKWGKGSSGSGSEDFLASISNFDASIFVAILLSGETGSTTSPIIEQYVGDLGFVTFIDNMYKVLVFLKGASILKMQAPEADNNVDEKITKLAQELWEKQFGADTEATERNRAWRSIEIAMNLVNKSDLLCDKRRTKEACADDTNNGESFRQMIRDDAQEILKSSGFYGRRYLEIIGGTLNSELRFLEDWIPLGAKRAVRKWSFRHDLAQVVWELYQSVKTLVENTSEGEPSGEEYAGACLPDVIRLIHVYNRMDISNALREALWRVKHDPGASRRELRHRWRALKIIGEEFTSLAEASAAAEDDPGHPASGNHFNDAQRTAKELKENFVLAFKIASKQA